MSSGFATTGVVIFKFKQISVLSLNAVFLIFVSIPLQPSEKGPIFKIDVKRYD